MVEDEAGEEEIKSMSEATRIGKNNDKYAADEKKYAEEMEKYDPEHVADLMFAKKERKIPGSVTKPHNPYVHLVQSNAMSTANRIVRVFFPYPQYCFRIAPGDSYLKVIDYSRVISAS